MEQLNFLYCIFNTLYSLHYIFKYPYLENIIISIVLGGLFIFSGILIKFICALHENEQKNA